MSHRSRMRELGITKVPSMDFVYVAEQNCPPPPRPQTVLRYAAIRPYQYRFTQCTLRTALV